MPEVYKFGGASIRDADAIRHLGELLTRQVPPPRALVVSAMGKTTNALEALLDAARGDDSGGYRERLAALRDDHLGVAAALFGTDAPVAADLERLLAALDAAHRRHRDAPYPVHYDHTVGFGELLSTTLVAAWLDEIGLATRWCDARELIVTDDRHQAAGIVWDETCARLTALATRDQRLLITQGFIGATAAGAMTTLGREGSDFSAAILAHCLDAEGLTIWKDVPGVFNADPRRVDNARQLERLSYAEAVEQSWHGAKVIHPRTLAPLQRKAIPLTVRSFLEPEATPSRIGPEPGDGDRVPACILRDDQRLLDIRPADFRFMDEGCLGEVLGHLARHGLHANFLECEAMRLRLAIDARPRACRELLDDLGEAYRVEETCGLTLLTLRHPDAALRQALVGDLPVVTEKATASTAQWLLPSDACPERWRLP
ncbi:aspartate kinase [Halomonas shengliensis]|uniref:Aspartokinase n=1 Tax=Halomonas shengliensis TaxID=419597 RepID=A0A1H0JJL2_9GAMM|nr:aspartate kinase [Halomonas shengliensis]SDO43985.1 aspartate kinase [Halomonas shengliensis]